MSHDYTDAAHLLRQVMQCLGAGAVKPGMQQQIFGRIAAQAQLWCQQQRNALLPGTLGIREDFCGVAAQVSDCAIDLCDGDFHVVKKYSSVTAHY